jgi:ribosome-associated protein
MELPSGNLSSRPNPVFSLHLHEESLPITASSLPVADQRSNRSLRVAQAAAQVAYDNLGQDIVLLDLREMTAVFDFFLLVTGASRRQLHAIADEVEHHLKDQFDDKLIGMEGYAAGTWILQDYGDLVIHLFDDKARDYYALEQLWTGAKRIDWQPAAPPHIAKLD